MHHFIETMHNGFVFFVVARLRETFWGIFLKKIWKSVCIFSKCTLLSQYNIEIGDFVNINNNTCMASMNMEGKKLKDFSLA